MSQNEPDWVDLQGKLATVEGIAEAKFIVIRDMPSADSRCRLLYANLQQFLQTFRPPCEAGSDELDA